MAKRILYCHSNIWHEFFSDLLYHYQEHYGSKAGIICDEAVQSLYDKNFTLEARHFPPPSFEDPKSWEKDPSSLRNAFEKLREYEHAAGKSSGRIILAGERTMGRGFSRGFYYWPKNRLQSACLKDNSIPGLVVLRLFFYLKEIVGEYNPDIIIARENNDPISLTMWLIAKKKAIPFVTCRFSKVVSRRAFWTDDFNMYNRLSAERYREKIEIGQSDVSDFAREYVTSFRENPRTVDYILKNWSSVKNWIGIHRNFLAIAKVNLLNALSGANNYPPKRTIPKAIEFYRIQWMKFYHKRYFKCFSSQDLKELNYAYFSQHKEPELMLNFEAPLWHDQRHAIKFICTMLPAGFKLLVREHRFNWGRRYTEYLNFLKGLPGVRLVDPFDNQFKYIENADIIITDNGSTGWEGLLLHKPVITLEKSFYEPVGLAKRVIDLTALDQDILEAIEKPAPCSEDEYDRALGLFIDAEHETSLDIDQMHDSPSLSVDYIDQLLGLN